MPPLSSNAPQTKDLFKPRQQRNNFLSRLFPAIKRFGDKRQEFFDNRGRTGTGQPQQQQQAQVAVSSATPTPPPTSFTDRTPKQRQAQAFQGLQQPVERTQLSPIQQRFAEARARQGARREGQLGSLGQAQRDVERLGTQSGLEREAQERLDEQQKVAREQINRLLDQPIVDRLRLGQAAALERQTQARSQTLQDALASAQQLRAEELGLAQSRLQRQEQQQSDIRSLAQSALQGGASQQQIQSILSSPTLDEAFARTAGSGLFRTPTAIADTGAGATDPSIQAFADAIKRGQATLANVPSELRGQVAIALGQSSGMSEAEQLQHQQTINTLTELENHPGFDSSVGPTRVQRTAGIGGRGNKLDFISKVTQIISQLSLDALVDAKDRGATFGALSDSELQILSASATKLGNAAIRRDDGTIAGFRLGERAFLQELRKLRQDYETALALDSQRRTEQGQQGNTGVTSSGINYTIEGNFSSVGGDTQQALNRPQRNQNPGNVKIGGVGDQYAIGTDEQGHLIFPNEEAGFRALEADLTAKITGGSRFVPANPTIAQLGKVYAEDPNWPNSVAQILGVDKNTKLTVNDLPSLVQAVARQEGFYA